MSHGNTPDSVARYSTPALWRDKPEAWHEVLPGVKRRILNSSPTGMMVLYKIEPGRAFPAHEHPHAQYGVILEGSGVLQLGGKRWVLGAGDSYYIPPGTRHELKIDPQKPCLLIDVFTPERSDYLPEALEPDE